MTSLTGPTQSILTAIVIDLERKIDNQRVEFPLGKVIHETLGITENQVRQFTAEIREKVLFPTDQ